jgi:hypothetical protein
MEKLILLCLFVLGSAQVFSQSLLAPIEVNKTRSTVFRQNGKNLSPKQLLLITQPNAAAYEEMKIAKSNFDVGYGLSFAGGLLVGYPLGTMIGGGKPNWALAGVGAGLIGVSIPFSVAYRKRAENAANIYNGGLIQSGVPNLDFKMGMTGDGLGIKMAF